MNPRKFASEYKSEGISLRQAQERYFIHLAHDKLYHDPMFQNFLKMYYVDCGLIESEYNK